MIENVKTLFSFMGWGTPCDDSNLVPYFTDPEFLTRPTSYGTVHLWYHTLTEGRGWYPMMDQWLDLVEGVVSPEEIGRDEIRNVYDRMVHYVETECREWEVYQYRMRQVGQ